MRYPFFLVSLASFAFSAVPNTFSKGQPAVAQQINDNFIALDTVLQKKASQATVDILATSLTTKADKSELDPLRAKIKNDSVALSKATIDSANSVRKVAGSALTQSSLAGIRDTLSRKANADALGAKQDALGFSPLNKAGDAMDGALTVGGGIIQLYPDPTFGAIYGDQAGTPEGHNYSLAWNRQGTEVFLRNSTSYFGLRKDLRAPIYWDGTEGSPERAVWHTGNLDPSVYVTTKGATLAGNEYNEISSVYNDNGLLETQQTPLASIRHALDFRWYESHWQIGNVRSNSNPSLGFGITNGNSDLRVLVGESRTTIYGDLVLPSGKLAATAGSVGDLRITGTLTTNPGDTPADYVFEPDYRLAPLSEVEAFTQANKHLPEVPSATEMTSNGVDLAKMNMLLLKKVEELTLHAIAQEKRMDAQQKQIEELRASRTLP